MEVAARDIAKTLRKFGLMVEAENVERIDRERREYREALRGIANSLQDECAKMDGDQSNNASRLRDMAQGALK